MGAIEFPVIAWLQPGNHVMSRQKEVGPLKVTHVHDDETGVYYEAISYSGVRLYLSLAYAHGLRLL